MTAQFCSLHKHDSAGGPEITQCFEIVNITLLVLVTYVFHLLTSILKLTIEPGQKIG